jgi:cytochrome c556
MKRTTVVALALAAIAVPAVAQQMKVEDQVKYRRAAYNVIALNFGSLGAMAQDKKPFNQDEAVRNADIVAILATTPKGFFGEGTDKDTKAKPEIWSKRADFDDKMEKMIAQAQKLPAAARGGDGAAFKKQVGDTAAACKACHDDYRAK